MKWKLAFGFFYLQLAPAGSQCEGYLKPEELEKLFVPQLVKKRLQEMKTDKKSHSSLADAEGVSLLEDSLVLFNGNVFESTFLRTGCAESSPTSDIFAAVKKLKASKNPTEQKIIYFVDGSQKNTCKKETVFSYKGSLFDFSTQSPGSKVFKGDRAQKR